MFMPTMPMLGSVGLFYAALFGLGTLLLFTLLLLTTGVTKSSASPQRVAQAVYCYLMQAIGIILMTLGGLPTVYAVLAAHPFATTSYLSLLFLFAIGGLIFLAHDHLIQRLDAEARAIPFLLYTYTLRVLGVVVSLMGLLLLLLRPLLTMEPLVNGWWAQPIVLILYGLLLHWSVSQSSPNVNLSFRSISLLPKSKAARVKKPAAKKVRKKATRKRVVRKKRK